MLLSLHNASDKVLAFIIGVVTLPVWNSKTELPPRRVGPVKSIEAATSAKVYSAIPVTSFLPSSSAATLQA